MPYAENTITVKRSPSDVFDYLADGTHNREWRSGVLEIERLTEEGAKEASTARS